MNVLGIDNGHEGAIASIGENIVVYDAPTYKIKKAKKTKTVYDIKEICNILENLLPIELCIIESAQAFPKQGSVSNFSTGNGFGIYKGVLTALKIPFEIVHPKKWQKIFSIAKKTKEQSYAIASQLFPNISFKGPKGGIKDGRSDSILMAEFGRRLLINDKIG